MQLKFISVMRKWLLILATSWKFEGSTIPFFNYDIVHVIKFSRFDRSSSSASPRVNVSRKYIAMLTILHRFFTLPRSRNQDKKRNREREREREREKERERERDAYRGDGNWAPTLHSLFETGSDTGRFR